MTIIKSLKKLFLKEILVLNNNIFDKERKIAKKYLEEILIITKKYPGEILITIGIGLSVYNLLDISYYDNRWNGGNHYHYSLDTLLYISIGAMLIVSGILIIKNNKKIKN